MGSYSNPTMWMKLGVFLILVFLFEVTLVGGDFTALGYGIPTEAVVVSTGFWLTDLFITVPATIYNILIFMLNVLTFNIPGIPLILRLFIAVPINFCIALMVLDLLLAARSGGGSGGGGGVIAMIMKLVGG